MVPLPHTNGLYTSLWGHSLEGFPRSVVGRGVLKGRDFFFPLRTPLVVAAFEVYTKGQPLVTREWHNFGSKLLVQPVLADAHGGPRAGMAITCGPFHQIARAHAPQTSYRAELMGCVWLCVGVRHYPRQQGSGRI